MLPDERMELTRRGGDLWRQGDIVACGRPDAQLMRCPLDGKTIFSCAGATYDYRTANSHDTRCRVPERSL